MFVWTPSMGPEKLRRFVESTSTPVPCSVNTEESNVHTTPPCKVPLAPPPVDGNEACRKYIHNDLRVRGVWFQDGWVPDMELSYLDFDQLSFAFCVGLTAPAAVPEKSLASRVLGFFQYFEGGYTNLYREIAKRTGYSPFECAFYCDRIEHLTLLNALRFDINAVVPQWETTPMCHHISCDEPFYVARLLKWGARMHPPRDQRSLSTRMPERTSGPRTIAAPEQVAAPLVAIWCNAWKALQLIVSICADVGDLTQGEWQRVLKDMVKAMSERPCRSDERPSSFHYRAASPQEMTVEFPDGRVKTYRPLPTIVSLLQLVLAQGTTLSPPKEPNLLSLAILSNNWPATQALLRCRTFPETELSASLRYVVSRMSDESQSTLKQQALIARALFRCGANPAEKDELGQSALEIAKSIPTRSFTSNIRFPRSHRFSLHSVNEEPSVDLTVFRRDLAMWQRTSDTPRLSFPLRAEVRALMLLYARPCTPWWTLPLEVVEIVVHSLLAGRGVICGSMGIAPSEKSLCPGDPEYDSGDEWESPAKICLGHVTNSRYDEALAGLLSISQEAGSKPLARGLTGIKMYLEPLALSLLDAIPLAAHRAVKACWEEFWSLPEIKLLSATSVHRVCDRLMECLALCEPTDVSERESVANDGSRGIFRAFLALVFRSADDTALLTWTVNALGRMVSGNATCTPAAWAVHTWALETAVRRSLEVNSKGSQQPSLWESLLQRADEELDSLIRPAQSTELKGAANGCKQDVSNRIVAALEGLRLRVAISSKLRLRRSVIGDDMNERCAPLPFLFKQ